MDVLGAVACNIVQLVAAAAEAASLEEVLLDHVNAREAL